MSIREPLQMEVPEEQVDAVADSVEDALEENGVELQEYELRIPPDLGTFSSSTEDTDTPVTEFEDSVRDALRIRFFGEAPRYRASVIYRSERGEGVVDVNIHSYEHNTVFEENERKSIEASLADAGLSILLDDSLILYQDDGDYIKESLE